VPNFCFIPADLNREIGSRPPSDYLARYRDENPEFLQAARSHLIPVEPKSSVWGDDFDAFLSTRAELIAHELSGLADSKPQERTLAGLIGSKNILEVAIDRVEIRLRDFIDERLTAVLGPHYWKKTVPGDVTASVERRISEEKNAHPFKDEDQFASGRARLDFCDVSAYEKIVSKNWTQFGEFLGGRGVFERHMSAFRRLRNCVKHSREYNDIDEQAGGADDVARAMPGRIRSEDPHIC